MNLGDDWAGYVGGEGRGRGGVDFIDVTLTVNRVPDTRAIELISFEIPMRWRWRALAIRK